jgi:hypothetical protein
MGRILIDEPVAESQVSQKRETWGTRRSIPKMNLFFRKRASGPEEVPNRDEIGCPVSRRICETRESITLMFVHDRLLSQE